jgi:hypothetical protein
MLEDNRDSIKTNIKGTSNKNSKYASQLSTLALIMNYGMAEQNRAVCAAIMKIGGKS